MKQNRLLYARACALPAIAAALALSSTPLSAQEAQPATATPPAPTTAEPPPTQEATPTTTDSTTSTTEEPVATDAAPVAKSTTTTTVRRTTRTAAAKPVTTARATTTRTAARASVPAPAVPAAPTPAQPATSQSAVAPVVDVNSTPATPTTTAAQPANSDETLPIAGGALALLALGGGAYVLSRRRRRSGEVEEWTYDEPADEPVAEGTPAAAAERETVIHEEQPAIVAPSAFAWGDKQHEQPRADQTADDDDRMPGESWIQRAYRGPTPNNPSVSLKARLRRAAFFDKRERDVAAGKAEPVDMDAGLPEAMVEEQDREVA